MGPHAVCNLPKGSLGAPEVRFGEITTYNAYPEVRLPQAALSGVIRRDRLIVVSSLKKINRTIAYAVNQPVFLGNTP
ncbi:MAG TPA: hypothetical protein VKB88_43555 [Bryobacteraceae bacterium]|nr:hypothetical protein [Bryobacteraceae bacterium]